MKRKLYHLMVAIGALLMLPFKKLGWFGRASWRGLFPAMADATFMPKIYEKDGGDTMIVASGGVVDFEASTGLKIGGTDVTSKLAAVPANANLVTLGVAAGYKIARGVHTQVAAQDTVVTGLATVVAVVANFDSVGPTVKQLLLSAGIGDQAGAPAAGSIYINTFKPTAVNDVTPTAATDFTDNVKIAWVAIGT